MISAQAIAHRLHTVIGYDKLVVLKDGLVAQCAPPLELLADKTGLFAEMCAALGSKAVQDLVDIATAAKEKKKLTIPVADDDVPSSEVTQTVSDDVALDVSDDE